jgi:7,8-dihydropterin-6-yl-methyl-4-(beta-D-ribofuranosyl)aminobenzene 5'-phosphate synthase
MGDKKMKTRNGICVGVLLFAAAFVFPGDKIQEGETTISIVIDDTRYNKELMRGTGFGCVINTPEANILFDTGEESGAGSVLISNMEKMDIDPMDIDMVVISHWHLTGGLEAFLDRNPNVTVYGPTSLNYKPIVESYGAEYRELSEFTNLSKNIYSTGGIYSKIDYLAEQSLVIDTEAGLVVVCGCAHPGIINVLEKIKKELPKREFYLVMGGFHLETVFQKQREQILSEFIRLGVKKVSPCHCSGPFREIAKREYKKNYIEGGSGQIIKL